MLADDFPHILTNDKVHVLVSEENLIVPGNWTMLFQFVIQAELFFSMNYFSAWFN